MNRTAIAANGWKCIPAPDFMQVVMDGDDFNMASLVNIRAMLEKGEE